MKPRPLPDFTNVPVTFVGPAGDIPAREVPGYENYFVCQDGRVWKKNKSPEQNGPGHFLKPYSAKSHNGYQIVSLAGPGSTRDKKVRRQFLLHRLVGAAWIPPPKDAERIEINHRNLDKANCHPSNIEWVSHQENVVHAVENGVATMTSEKAKEIWTRPGHRTRMARKSRQRWMDPAYRTKVLKRWEDPENRERARQQGKQRWEDPEYRERCTAAIKEGRRWKDPHEKNAHI